MHRSRTASALLGLLAAALLQPASAEDFDPRWEIGLSFGEIPVLAGSFKPGLLLGYRFSEQFSLVGCLQMKDYLQRDGSSFNARNTGLGGLLSSKETTGARALLAARYRPVEWAPYLQAGFVWNGEDIETMRFDARERQVGTSVYDGELSLVQSRSAGFGPAFGLGYAFELGSRLRLDTGIAAALMTPISDPRVAIRSARELEAPDQEALVERIRDAYRGNFHNRYHVFTLGLSYAL